LARHRAERSGSARSENDSTSVCDQPANNYRQLRIASRTVSTQDEMKSQRDYP
jgi:hypothetical protein